MKYVGAKRKCGTVLETLVVFDYTYFIYSKLYLSIIFLNLFDENCKIFFIKPYE